MWNDPLRRLPRSPSFKRRSAPGERTPRSYTRRHHDMAACFLQYCAMCERQILTPSNSILYCSEACRRKDSCKPLELAAVAMSPSTSPTTSMPSSPRPILPRRTPTGTMTESTSSISIFADRHNAKSDRDPTKWRPQLHRRAESEAFRYLSRFHHSTSGVGSTDANDEKTAHHPLLAHSSTTSMASMPGLSLSQTPSTASSSLSVGTDYDFNPRPLQSRQNPMSSTSAGTTKGIDLVMPFVAPSIATSLPRPERGWRAREEVPGQDFCFGWRRSGWLDWI
jgi:hypothetical protein